MKVNSVYVTVPGWILDAGYAKELESDQVFSFWPILRETHFGSVRVVDEEWEDVPGPMFKHFGGGGYQLEARVSLVGHGVKAVDLGFPAAAPDVAEFTSGSHLSGTCVLSLDIHPGGQHLLIPDSCRSFTRSWRTLEQLSNADFGYVFAIQSARAN